MASTLDRHGGVSQRGGAHGGANTWTGGRPAGTIGDVASVVASDPAEPYVVYGGFGSDLYRSSDGGNTWIRLGSFGTIKSVLVQPSSPAAIYVAVEYAGSSRARTRVRLGAPSSPDRERPGRQPGASLHRVRGGDFGIHRTDDGGAHWSSVTMGMFIGCLVLDPSDKSVAYAGAEGFHGLGEYPGALLKTTDGGASWQDTNPKAFESVEAVAVDTSASATIYIATGPSRGAHPRSGSGPARPPAFERRRRVVVVGRRGLPGGKALTLVSDSLVSGTLYAGTESGIYWTRDRGRAGTLSALLSAR
jgi:photosystem II stability/assembly factor-like uncharacterized protein